MGNERHEGETSVEKALHLLSAYAECDHELGITEVAGQLGLHKATASRLIKSLVGTGYLEQNPISKKYFLGKAAHQIGDRAMRALNNRIIVTAKPYLEELAQQTGETTALELLSGFNVIMVLHVEGPGHLRFNFRQGEIVPINVSVGAKALLAYGTPELLEVSLRRKLEVFNEHTIVDADKFRQLLRTIRKEGVAYDRGERYQEIHAIGAPILPPDKAPEGAITIAGPSSRMTDEFLQSLISPLKKTAKEIANALYPR